MNDSTALKTFGAHLRPTADVSVPAITEWMETLPLADVKVVARIACDGPNSTLGSYSREVCRRAFAQCTRPEVQVIADLILASDGQTVAQVEEHLARQSAPSADDDGSASRRYALVHELRNVSACILANAFTSAEGPVFVMPNGETSTNDWQVFADSEAAADALAPWPTGMVLLCTEARALL